MYDESEFHLRTQSVTTLAAYMKKNCEFKPYSL